MYEWQLNDLYAGYESDEFKQDWQKLESFGNKVQQLEFKDELATIKEINQLKEQFLLLARRLGAYISLNLATNTSDEISTNFRSAFSQMMSGMTKEMTQINQFLGSVETDITRDSELSDYQFAFEEWRLQKDYQLAEDIEEVIAKLQISGSNSWSNLQTFLTSNVETTLNGKTYNLSEIRNLAYDADSGVRQAAYEAELKMYEQIKDPVAFAINNIKKEVLTTSKMRGFESPLDETLFHSRMQKETLESLMAAIKKFLPEFRRYLKIKANYLGHQNGLPFYDLFAPLGATSKQFTVEESGEYLVTHFKSFSIDLAALVESFYANDYIDFLPKKGKRGGAFCSNLPFIEQSRILTNFDGSLSSVITLAHELGHAYHGSIIQAHKPLNWSYSMPVAETASTFNETIIMDELITNSDSDEEKLALIESLLQDTTQIIVDIYSRFYFESKLFEAEENQFLFSHSLEELMIEAQKEAYGDGLDQNYLHPFMWINKGHYYSSNLSFYNFPYAYGGLFARGLYTMYQEKPEGFVKQYNELLYQTTVSTVEDTAKVMDIDVTSSAFWEKSLQSYVSYIDQFEALTKN